MSIPTYNGQTIPILSIEPDWSQQIRLGFVFRTDINESLSNKEERQSRFPHEFWALKYTSATLTEQESGYLRQLLETADDLPVGCPVWPFASQLTGAIIAGAVTMAVDDTTDCQFDQRTYALIWESFDNWEVVTIEAVEANSITLAAGVVNGYSSGAIIMPLIYGQLDRSSTKPVTDEMSEWDCGFKEVALSLV